jgi:tRNA(adenine34) deaminase
MNPELTSLTFEEIDQHFMSKALYLAQKAALLDEVPCGAVVVRSGVIVGYGYNRRETSGLPTRHAEIEAMEMAAQHIGYWRLNDCTLYVTKEPCVMCAGALVQARVDRVVFGCYDARYGCCGSIYSLPEDERFNHRLAVTGGVMEEECKEVLQKFFRQKRQKK